MGKKPNSLTHLLNEYHEIEDEFADAEARYESNRQDILQRIHRYYLDHCDEEPSEVVEEVEDLLDDEGLELRDDWEFCE